MLLEKLRSRSREESGFTLVELLVVMLILGILAAIAIPSFFNQRDKARDADAKSAARTAQTAIETFATDNNGSYAGANNNVTALEQIEPTLTGRILSVAATNNTYTVTAESEADNREFWIERQANGTTLLECAPVGGGCPTGGKWG